MPRPIRRQYEIATFLDFWKRPSGFGEGFLADVSVAMGFKSKLRAVCMRFFAQNGANSCELLRI
jgi:hypothetical protein